MKKLGIVRPTPSREVKIPVAAFDSAV